jgi:hypothetical protein
MEAKVLPDNLQELQQKIAHAEEVKRITLLIHEAKDVDQILVDLNKEILGLFDADGLTLYAVDSERKEIVSKVLIADTVEEIRLPISEQSLPSQHPGCLQHQGIARHQSGAGAR